MLVLCIFLVGYKSHESAQKKLKILKMEAISESRQGVLAAAASAKINAANYTLIVAKAKLAATKNLRQRES